MVGDVKGLPRSGGVGSGERKGEGEPMLDRRPRPTRKHAQDGSVNPRPRSHDFNFAHSGLSEVFAEVERASLWVTDLEFLRLHYAKTLNHWCQRFEANRASIAAMYDDRFCRMWEFYLISAEMMFRTGSQLVFQMQLARKRDAIPIVRDYITDIQRRYREPLSVDLDAGH
jgi:cyclopropane-fatty-acyl-phospholipid synthase